jgi:hypothetical protein
MQKIILFIFLGLMACSSSNSPTPETISPQLLVGQWRYVGTFSHLIDYRCVICPNFDFEKSLYFFNLQSDGQFDMRVNLLFVQGQMLFKPRPGMPEAGDFSLLKFQIGNTPPETRQDTEFQQRFQLSSAFSYSKYSHPNYDQLLLSQQSEYLLFVRKKP